MDDIDTISRDFERLLVDDTGLDSVMEEFDTMLEEQYYGDYSQPITFVGPEFLEPVESDEMGVENAIDFEPHDLYDDKDREAALHELIDVQEDMAKTMANIEATANARQLRYEEYARLKHLFNEQKNLINRAQSTFNTFDDQKRREKWKSFKAYTAQLWNVAMPLKADRDRAWQHFEAIRSEAGNLWDSWKALQKYCQDIVKLHPGLWTTYFRYAESIITPYMVYGEVDRALDDPNSKDYSKEQWEDIFAGHQAYERELNHDPIRIPDMGWWAGLQRWLEGRQETRQDFFENLAVKRELNNELMFGSERDPATVQDELEFCKRLAKHLSSQDHSLVKYVR